MAESFQSSSQSSSSTSAGSYIPDYIQSPFLMQVAQGANDIAQQLYQWGQQQYARTSQITEDGINQYLANSQLATGLGANAIDRYTGKFQPLEDQLIKDANTYASDARIKDQMGMAEAGVMQGADAARQNALRDLRSYGIDPSSGRYAGLDAISRTAAGAAAAGAGQQARLATEATGRQLRSQAIQVGQQYPAQAVNALNTGLQGVAGAVNAGLANANTGVNLMGLPDKYLGTAMGLKYPPLGTGPSSSRSAGASAGRSTSPNPKDQQQQQRPDTSGQGAGQGPGTRPAGPTTPPSGPATIMNPYPGPSIQNTPGADQYGVNTGIPDWEGYNAQDWEGYNPDQAAQQDWEGYNAQDWEGYNQPVDQYNEQGYGPENDYGMNYNESGYSPYTDYSGGTENYAAMPDYGASDYGGYEGDYAYAKGGEVGGIPGPDATTGGFVPKQASPSNGQVQDDVNANLNAEEFVLPRDVVRWKGEEHFHKLIAQSREARMKAQQTVAGKPGQQQPGPARFASQPVGNMR